MTPEINDLGALAGVSWFDYQVEYLSALQEQQLDRSCLYYKTGAGKSVTSLAGLKILGHKQAVVIAPPSTHKAWEAQATKLGITVECMSHAKFRMKDTKLSRHIAVIADEMHMFGGNTGNGWKKLDQLAKHLKAPLIMASATPNYNDAERVYCIQRILDLRSTRGGFLEFLHTHCNTHHNPYGQTPLVDEDRPFVRFKDAAEYLASLPGVFYLPDDVVYQIHDLEYPEEIAWPIDVFGYDERNHRVIASQMEERHTRRFQGLVDSAGLIHDHIFEMLVDLAGSATTPLLVYANHATVAEALGRSLDVAECSWRIVTGDTSKADKNAAIQAFIDGELSLLVGTASLATGTDGMDKMCDWLVILDDTDDDALRRQLIGRIMPRGADTDASKKNVYRFVPVP